MNAHTITKILEHNGKPAFAIIPWDEYQALLNNQIGADESDVIFPHEVVMANVRGDSLIKAWREHFGLTQDELASRSGIKQPALARLEKSDANPRRSTLKKIAEAMNITVEQLID